MGLKKRMAEVAAAPEMGELKAIRKQFVETESLYSLFATGKAVPVNQRDYRIPLFESDPHPWTKPDGLAAYTQLMRGEIELPHAPLAPALGVSSFCKECLKAFRIQLDLLRSNHMLAKHGDAYYSSRRSLVTKRLHELAARGTV